MGRDVTSGKGNSVQLEGLHGAITKVYTEGVLSILDDIDRSEKLQLAYQLSCKEAEDAGEDTHDIPKPSKVRLNKDELALLKQAQGFLKENDVQMDVVKTSGSRQLRGKVSKILESKRNEVD
jgi:hypothetical protein